MKEAADAGWGAPDQAARSTSILPAPGADQGRYVPPISDGPVSTWHGGVMTVSGTITATMVMLAILLATATAGWFLGPSPESDQGRGFPALALFGILVGFGCAIAVHFRPMLAKMLGPVYAFAYGFLIGVISRS